MQLAEGIGMLDDDLGCELAAPAPGPDLLAPRTAVDVAAALPMPRSAPPTAISVSGVLSAERYERFGVLRGRFGDALGVSGSGVGSGDAWRGPWTSASH
jgi:hypothetical protein